MVFEIGHRFALVPLYLVAWPVDLYDEWLVVQAAVIFLPLADLDIMPYFSSAATMAWARRDAATFDRLLRIAFGLYSLFIALATPLYVAAVLLIAPEGGLDHGAMSASAELQVWLALSLFHPPHPAGGAPGHLSGQDLPRPGDPRRAAEGVGPIGGGRRHAPAPRLTGATGLAAPRDGYVPLVADQKRRYPDLCYRLALPSRVELRSFIGNLGWFTVLPVADRLIANGPVLVLGLVASEAAVVVFSTLRVLAGVIRAGAERLSFLAGAEMAALYTPAGRPSASSGSICSPGGWRSA